MSPSLSIFALLILLLCLLLTLVILKYPTTNRNQHQLPPSLPGLPFIGNAHQLGPLPHRTLHSLAQRYGPCMSLRIGMVPTLVVSSADGAREVMKTHDHIFSTMPPFKAPRILFKNGMAVGFANGEQWRQGRKLFMTHLLGPKMVRSFQHIRDEEVASLLASISADASLGQVTNLGELLLSLTNKITCRAILGDFSREGMNSKLIDLSSQDSCLVQKFWVGDYFPFLGLVDELSGLAPRTRRLAKNWNDFLDEVIEGIQHGDDDDQHKTSNFLGSLLSLQKDSAPDMNLTTDRIKVLVHQLILAGTATSSATLEWAMAELVRNPKVMNKLRDEVRQMVQREQRVREEDLSQMVYLKAVIKETLRLHPPGPTMVPKEALQPCRLYGYDVPVKTRVIVNVWSIGQDPQIWEAPELFRPERFLESSIDYKGHDFGFIPFGAGRRICPGLQFTEATMELALANLMHQFDWQLPDGIKIQDLNMAEAPGLIFSKKERLQLGAKKISDD